MENHAPGGEQRHCVAQSLPEESNAALLSLPSKRGRALADINKGPHSRNRRVDHSEQSTTKLALHKKEVADALPPSHNEEGGVESVSGSLNRSTPSAGRAALFTCRYCHREDFQAYQILSHLAKRHSHRQVRCPLCPRHLSRIPAADLMLHATNLHPDLTTPVGKAPSREYLIGFVMLNQLKPEFSL